MDSSASSLTFTATTPPESTEDLATPTRGRQPALQITKTSLSSRSLKRKQQPVKPAPLEERKRRLREVQEELKQHKQMSPKNNVDSEDHNDEISEMRRKLAPKSFPELEETLNLSSYVKHIDELKDVLEDRSFDSSVDDHNKQMRNLVRKMRRSLNKISEVRDSFQHAVSMGMETINMRQKIQELEGTVQNVELEKERVLSSQQVLSASMRENERVMMGAMKREDVLMSKMRARVSELEFITKKQHETMQLVLKIAQYKQISFEHVSNIYNNICHSFDVFRQTARGNDAKVMERLNKMHQDFLLETVRTDGSGQTDPASDMELIKIILRNTRNTHEATQWIDDRIKQNMLENQVRTVLDQAKANNVKIKRSQLMQKQPTFLKEMEELDELPSPSSAQRQMILTPRGAFVPPASPPLSTQERAKSAQSTVESTHDSSPAPEIEIFPESPRSSNSFTNDTPSTPAPVPVRTRIITPGSGRRREYLKLKVFPPRAPRPNSPKLKKRASMPSKTLQQLIKDVEAYNEMDIKPLKRAASFTDMALTEKGNTLLKKKPTLRAILKEPHKHKNVSVRALVDHEAEVIIELNKISKDTWSTEEWQYDLEQERDILERAKTLSMYYRERERAARNERELEAEQVAVLKDLEILEKKRLEHAMKVKGRATRVIDRDQRCVMFLIIEGYKELINKDAFSMGKAMETYERNIRTLCNVHRGDVFRNHREVIGIVFRDLHQCVSFAIDLQLRLNEALWPKQLLKHRQTKIIRDEEGAILFSGLRIKMGVNIGSPLVTSNDAGKLQYIGPSVDRAQMIAEHACGGEIVIGSPVYPHLRKWNLIEDFQTKLEVKLRGIEMIGDKAIRIPETLRTLMPQELLNRISYFESASTVNTKGRALDMYPLIEALIQSAQNVEHPSDREEILVVLRHVYVQCAKVLKQYTKETQFAEILNKMYKFKQLLKKSHAHRRNINTLRERVNAFREEFAVYGAQIMGVLTEFVSSLSSEDKTKYDWTVLQRNITQRETILTAMEERMFSQPPAITHEDTSTPSSNKRMSIPDRDELEKLKSQLKLKQEELAAALARKNDEESKMCQTEPVQFAKEGPLNAQGDASFELGGTLPWREEHKSGYSTSSISVQTVLVLGGLTEEESALLNSKAKKRTTDPPAITTPEHSTKKSTKSAMLSPSRVAQSHSESSGILEIKRSPIITADDLKKPAPQKKERIKRKEEINFDPVVMRKARSFKKRGKSSRLVTSSSSPHHSDRKTPDESKGPTEVSTDVDSSEKIETHPSESDLPILTVPPKLKDLHRRKQTEQAQKSPLSSSQLLTHIITPQSGRSMESVDAQLDSLRHSMTSLLDSASKETDTDEFETIIIKRVHLKHSSMQTDIEEAPKLRQMAGTTTAQPSSAKDGPRQIVHTSSATNILRSFSETGVQTVSGDIPSEKKTNPESNFPPMERPPTEYERQFLPAHLAVLSEDLPDHSTHELQKKWRELLCSKKRDDRTEVQVIMARARNMERRRSQDPDEVEEEDGDDESVEENSVIESDEGVTTVRGDAHRKIVTGSSATPALPPLFVPPQTQTETQIQPQQQQSPQLAGQAQQQQMVYNNSPYASGTYNHTPHYYPPHNNTAYNNAPVNVVAPPVQHEQSHAAHDPYFAKVRAEYLKNIKQNATDMKQKYDQLVSREQLVRKQEKQLRNLFKQLNKYIKMVGLGFEDPSVEGNSAAYEPLFSQGVTLPQLYRSPHVPLKTRAPAGDNMNGNTSQHVPRHARAQTKQGWHNLRHHIMQFSKELTESMPKDDDRYMFYVNGNAWFDCMELDPKGMFDLVAPFHLKSHQAFGPSSLNNAAKWNYANVVEQFAQEQGGLTQK